MRLTNSWHLWLYSLINLCLISQGAFLDNTKQDPVPKVEELGQALQSPKGTIPSRSDLPRSSQVDAKTTQPKEENRDRSFTDVQRPSSDNPSQPRKPIQGPRDQSSFLEKWPNRIQRLRSRFKKLKTDYRRLVRSTKAFLNLFERYNKVAIFSEIDYLKEIFGETYDYYKTLDRTEQNRFWEIFEEIGKSEHAGLSPRLAKTSTFARNARHELAKVNRDRVRTSKRVVFRAMQILEEIEKGQDEYDKALESSTKLVEDFVRSFTNNGKVPHISQRIRDWKREHPLGIPPMEYQYQLVFAAIFGPGDITKPQKNDFADFRRFEKLWQVTHQQMHAIWEVSSEAKSMLADLYTAEEKNAQRGLWLWKYLSPTSEYKQAIQKSREQQKAIHEKLSAVFESKQALEEKMEAIAETRALDEEWTDKRFSSVHYDLLPFIDPLRATRRYEDHPDITPLLRHFGIHTTPRAIKRLMELSEALIPHLRVQYKQQILAGDVRRVLETGLNGATQYRISILLKKVVEKLQSTTPEPRPLHSRLFDAAKGYILRFINSFRPKRAASTARHSPLFKRST
ncbi:uncharacterized protein PGTG_07141 [Puccinia graminis f. sp. tritici CRL 75-36-700-3]|uniref:Uncharacterized protein n=1 Tax=Puccinia graminis f. sp. tritici (strain CRL 75-36-700-3 / race SCCL) TaxID=418459 RepID=E3K9G4_PUCGT|nr:uncharacterized protein PGTG_07141 [Puccinia graminis f. sp. tritici CRL 75-36-700-3]EFP80889.2 hypothetical protein PGTG_07141 [Puccinia graminis f. sp. tritici CRL 75-36-700-3]